MEPSPPRNACYVGDSASLQEILLRVWGPETARWTFFRTGREAAGILLTSPPDMLLFSLTLPDMPGLQLATLFKEENIYSQVPVLLCVTAEEANGYPGLGAIIADDFLVFPDRDAVIRARLDLACTRSLRTLDANPLTHLPGNTSIIKRTQGLIDQNQNFALGYCDLDYFKPFNDKYGFSRGDEVLMMTSRIILNSVQNHKLPFSFVGHVGGDDYVFIVPIEAAESVCRKIIAAFDSIIPRFYDEDDREKGRIISVDRQNAVREFPLMAISIAVVFNRDGNLKHYGEASSHAMHLKKVAKQTETSSYVLDRRGSTER